MRTRSAVIVVLLALLTTACSETRRSLGEECLKSDDCLSGICSQLLCSASPLLLDGSIGPSVDATAAPEDAPTVVDAADADAAPADASSDAPSE